MHRRAPLSLLLAGLLLPASAHAATVSVARQVYHDPGAPGKVPPTTVITAMLVLDAAPGEVNRVTVGEAGDGAFAVRDDGAPLVAGAGCSAGTDGVLCAVETGASRAMRVALGDGDDQLDVTLTGPNLSASSTIDGAAGDDRLTARSGIVEGGEGDDVLAATLGASLRGGLGTDRLSGGPSNDVLDGGRGTDVLDGGGGADRLSYAGRAEPVVVDLGAATAGANGEDDAIANLEGADGGDGADILRARPDAAARLTGGGGEDVLEGGPLDDHLLGGAGADRLAGGDGRDELDGDEGDDALDGGAGRDWLAAGYGDDVAAGGAGNDRVDDGYGHDVVHGDAGADEIYGEIADGGDGNDKLEGDGLLSGGPGDDHLLPIGRTVTERLDCGPGRDTVERPARYAVLPAGCELVTPVSFWKPVIGARPFVGRRVVALRFPYPCIVGPRWARCRIAGELLVAGRHVASAESAWARDRRDRVLRWRVRARVSRMIRQGAVVRFALTRHEVGDKSRGGYAIRLGKPGPNDARRPRTDRLTWTFSSPARVRAAGMPRSRLQSWASGRRSPSTRRSTATCAA